MTIAMPVPATDEELVVRAQRGDEAALRVLIDRYRALVRAKGRRYFLPGADRDDLVQEGLIGLFKAVRDFDSQHGAPFHAFADVCVTRQVLTAVKSAARYKHGPLNTCVSLDRPTVIGDVPGAAVADPAEVVVSMEQVRDLQRYIDAVLSDLEVEVLRLHVEGKSYQEIAARLDRHVKAVDNALQRVKRKIVLHLESRHLAEAG